MRKVKQQYRPAPKNPLTDRELVEQLRKENDNLKSQIKVLEEESKADLEAVVTSLRSEISTLKEKIKSLKNSDTKEAIVVTTGVMHPKAQDNIQKLKHDYNSELTYQENVLINAIKKSQKGDEEKIMVSKAMLSEHGFTPSNLGKTRDGLVEKGLLDFEIVDVKGVGKRTLYTILQKQKERA